MAKKYQLVDADFGKDTNPDVERFVHENLEWLEQIHRDMHTTKLPKWRDLYLGTPAQATRNFPFPNAANTVVQVVGETVDTMVARVMGLIYATHPLWAFQSYVKAKKQAELKRREQVRRVLEDFMEIVGIEPDELDLQFVEALWFTDAAKLGTAFVKIGMEDVTESVVTGYTEVKSKKGFKGEEFNRTGPTVVKLRHEDVMADPSAQTLDKADFVSVRHALKRWQLEDRAQRDIYDKKVVEEILGSPDRPVPAEGERRELGQQGVQPSARPEVSAEWDIYECYFPWWHNGRKFRLIYSYHKKSKKVLRRVFNFLPKNELPVKRAKLGYRTDGLYGHGYAELMENYQEELSSTHNQRLDNATVANIRALRISPRARALDANVELYPSALLVGDKDDIEAIAVGDVYPSTFKNEEMTLELVARRAGITPAVSGAGTGGVMKRPNVYSSQGTLAVMQENNSVVGFATSEFRHAHVILGAAVASLYGKFGTDGREEMFGLDGALLEEALEEFMDNRIRIPMRASTGSLNREIDKQTGIVIAGVLERYFTSVGQLMQAIANPIAPPEFKSFAVKRIMASETFYRKVMKDFGYEQPELYIPDSGVTDEQAGPVQGGPMASQGSPMAGPSAGPGGAGGGMVPLERMDSTLAGLAPAAGGGPR